ncbi:MAG: ATPase [Gammaproteobacteria bacterium RBG_16_57_12]|nr:MAG: ATPase [Gammaproteobacteria bacterium RBG_16_57_12]
MQYKCILDDKSPVYIHRTLENFVKKAALQFPVVLVTGARQVGKTTLLQRAAGEQLGYVTLDDPLVLGLARDDPALFMQRFPPPVLIDEIQYAPQLLPYIKMAVDETRKPNQFWLTGSPPFHLMQGVSESLAGRVAVIQLLGLSRRELMRQAEESRPFLPTPEEINARCASGRSLRLRELYQLIWRGSFPAIALDDGMDRDLFYRSYVQTYLQRDIRDLARVGNEMAFLRFLRTVAARTGQLLNLAELARDADVAPNTAKSWLSILQSSGLVYLLEPYHTNIAKRLVKTPKLYFLDTGLCAYLTEWSSPETLEAGAMAGAVLETWMMTELLKGYWHNGLAAPFYYYRDKDQREIDLLILKDGVLYPLEFKKSASPRKEMVRHFQVLEKFNVPIGPGGVVCLVEQALPLTDRAQAMPAGCL